MELQQSKKSTIDGLKLNLEDYMLKLRLNYIVQIAEETKSVSYSEFAKKLEVRKI